MSGINNSNNQIKLKLKRYKSKKGSMLRTTLNKSADTSQMQKLTLRSNNKALAVALENRKEEIKVLQDQNMSLQSECQQLRKKCFRLQSIAGSNDDCINREVQRRINDYMQYFSSSLNSGMQMIINGIDKISDVRDKCNDLTAPDSFQSSLTSPKSDSDVFMTCLDNSLPTTTTVQPFHLNKRMNIDVCDMSVIQEMSTFLEHFSPQLETVPESTENEPPLNQTYSNAQLPQRVRRSQLLEEENSSITEFEEVNSNIDTHATIPTEQIENGVNVNRRTKAISKVPLEASPSKSDNEPTASSSRIVARPNRKTRRLSKDPLEASPSKSDVECAASSVRIFAKPNRRTRRISKDTLEASPSKSDDEFAGSSAEIATKRSRRTRVLSKVAFEISPSKSDDDIADSGDGILNNTKGHEGNNKSKGSMQTTDSALLKPTQLLEVDGHPIVQENNTKNITDIEVRMVKPGKLVYVAGRKNSDGSRKDIPQNIPAKSRSKAKKLMQQSDSICHDIENIFDFHDKTPMALKDKVPKPTQDLSEMSFMGNNSKKTTSESRRATYSVQPSKNVDSGTAQTELYGKPKARTKTSSRTKSKNLKKTTQRKTFIKPFSPNSTFTVHDDDHLNEVYTDTEKTGRYNDGGDSSNSNIILGDTPGHIIQSNSPMCPLPAAMHPEFIEEVLVQSTENTSDSAIEAKPSEDQIEPTPHKAIKSRTKRRSQIRKTRVLQSADITPSKNGEGLQVYNCGAELNDFTSQNKENIEELFIESNIARISCGSTMTRLVDAHYASPSSHTNEVSSSNINNPPVSQSRSTTDTTSSPVIRSVTPRNNEPKCVTSPTASLPLSFTHSIIPNNTYDKTKEAAASQERVPLATLSTDQQMIVDAPADSKYVSTTDTSKSRSTHSIEAEFGGRTRRNAGTRMSYKEPSLVKKMRRPINIAEPRNSEEHR